MTKENSILMQDKDNIIYPIIKSSNIVDIDNYLCNENLIVDPEMLVNRIPNTSLKYTGKLHFASNYNIQCKATGGIDIDVLSDSITISGVKEDEHSLEYRFNYLDFYAKYSGEKFSIALYINEEKSIKLPESFECSITTYGTGGTNSLLCNMYYNKDKSRYESEAPFDLFESYIDTVDEFATLKISTSGAAILQYNIKSLKLELGNVCSNYSFSNVEIEKIRVNGYNTIKDKIFGFKVDRNNIDPDIRVIYTNDCEGYSPMYISLSSGECNNGSWSEFLEYLHRPCILNKDGSVAFYLDRNNQLLKDTGESYTLTDDQNMMVEFKTVYTKRWSDEDYIYHQFSFIPRDGFNAYPWTNKYGVVQQYMYLAMYDGNIVSNIMRSLNGVKSTVVAIDDILTAANINGEGWSTEWSQTYFFRMDILTLLSKSTHSKESFGYGINDETSDIINGSLISKGSFYGRNVDDKLQVKTLFMEGLWGGTNIFIDGIKITDSELKISTFGNFDDNTSYNYTHDITTNETNIIEYIGNMSVNNEGYVVEDNIGSTNTGYCDGYIYQTNTNSTTIATIGGQNAGSYMIQINSQVDTYSTSRLCYIPI